MRENRTSGSVWGAPGNGRSYHEIIKIKMDIEALKKKRQLNVQEQNALEKHYIMAAAKYWRKNPIPTAIINLCKSKGIDIDKSLLLRYSQDFPGCSTDFGVILTPEGKFIEFDMDLSNDREKIIEIYEWKDITNKTEIMKSKPGTGSTWGYLALQVQTELNSK